MMYNKITKPEDIAVYKRDVIKTCSRLFGLRQDISFSVVIDFLTDIISSNNLEKYYNEHYTKITKDMIELHPDCKPYFDAFDLNTNNVMPTIYKVMSSLNAIFKMKYVDFSQFVDF